MIRIDSSDPSKDESTVKEPLLKKVGVKKVVQDSHARKTSSEWKVGKDRGAGDEGESIEMEERIRDAEKEEMDSKYPSVAPFERKSTSESRKPNIKPLVFEQLSSQQPKDLPTPVQRIRHDSQQKTPPSSSSPVGNFMHKNLSSFPPISRTGLMETIAIRVFFSDGQGMEFKIEGGRQAEAQFLLQLVAHQRNIEEKLALEAFSLWMISPLLELQLKPHHFPYELRRQWAYLLSKFTHATRAEIRDDEPSLVMRRNVSLEASREIELCENEVICAILFEDARHEFLGGRYAVDDCRSASELAGLSMCAVLGEWNEGITTDLVRREVDDHLPSRLLPSVRGPMVFGRALSGTREMEEILLASWKSCNGRHDAMKKFLRKVADSPCYGSAFFTGCIERPSPSLRDIKRWFHSSNEDIKVCIGINRSYVTVVDPSKGDILLVQLIDDCSWRKVEPEQKQVLEGAECSLLLHFPEDSIDVLDKQPIIVNGEKKKVKKRSKGQLKGEDMSPPANTKLLQIFGPQAVMLDALLTAMHSLKEGSQRERSQSPDEGYSNESFEPSSSSSSEGSSTRSGRIGRQPSITKGNRMCLATFNPEGKCLGAQGSLKKVLQVN